MFVWWHRRQTCPYLYLREQKSAQQDEKWIFVTLQISCLPAVLYKCLPELVYWMVMIKISLWLLGYLQSHHFYLVWSWLTRELTIFNFPTVNLSDVGVESFKRQSGFGPFSCCPSHWKTFVSSPFLKLFNASSLPSRKLCGASAPVWSETHYTPHQTC